MNLRCCCFLFNKKRAKDADEDDGETTISMVMVGRRKRKFPGRLAPNLWPECTVHVLEMASMGEVSPPSHCDSLPGLSSHVSGLLPCLLP